MQTNKPPCAHKSTRRMGYFVCFVCDPALFFLAPRTVFSLCAPAFMHSQAARIENSVSTRALSSRWKLQKQHRPERYSRGVCSLYLPCVFPRAESCSPHLDATPRMHNTTRNIRVRALPACTRSVALKGTGITGRVLLDKIKFRENMCTNEFCNCVAYISSNQIYCQQYLNHFWLNTQYSKKDIIICFSFLSSYVSFFFKLDGCKKIYYLEF
jgi:hypothetical protein